MCALRAILYYKSRARMTRKCRAHTSRAVSGFLNSQPPTSSAFTSVPVCAPRVRRQCGARERPLRIPLSAIVPGLLASFECPNTRDAREENAARARDKFVGNGFCVHIISELKAQIHHLTLRTARELLYAIFYISSKS